ncbi:MAG: HNH endonuclease [Oscillospiraceae bacterium]|nr:HNH endonuclease [Oscillospiraceae bacterium]
MPYKNPHPCVFPHCREVTYTKYCPKHQPLLYNSERRKHYDRRWEKVRALYLSKHPLCVHCEQSGRLTPATEVHHICPVSQGGGDNDENLMALCKSCHSRITWGSRG